jgi:hypothetical protein
MLSRLVLEPREGTGHDAVFLALSLAEGFGGTVVEFVRGCK